MDIEDFSATIARPDLFLAGGSVAAYAGSFAAALGEMMAGVTEGRPKFAGQESRIKKIHKELTDARAALKNLAEEDSIAFRSVLTARRMPRSTNEENIVRAEAIERTIKYATETPLRNARTVFRVLELLRILIEIGNPNARADAAVGAQLAYASLKGSQYIVLTNIPGITDRAFAEDCRIEAANLEQRARQIVQQINFKVEGS